MIDKPLQFAIIALEADGKKLTAAQFHAQIQ